jgi:NAD(P)-dependent dehydrogenase (short-subunit alcohol dehydrogenase family)
MVFAQAAQHISDGGRIIAFSSSVLLKAFPTYGAYIAAKAGVEGLGHVLANELAGRNITVNGVAPLAPLEQSCSWTERPKRTLQDCATCLPYIASVNQRISRMSCRSSPARTVDG